MEIKQESYPGNISIFMAIRLCTGMVLSFLGLFIYIMAYVKPHDYALLLSRIFPLLTRLGPDVVSSIAPVLSGWSGAILGLFLDLIAVFLVSPKILSRQSIIRFLILSSAVLIFGLVCFGFAK